MYVWTVGIPCAEMCCLLYGGNTHTQPPTLPSQPTTNQPKNAQNKQTTKNHNKATPQTNKQQNPPQT